MTVQGKCMKMSFPDKKQAKEFLLRQKKDGHAHNDRHLLPYECERCGRWHFTSQNKKIQRSKRRRREKRLAEARAHREAQREMVA